MKNETLFKQIEEVIGEKHMLNHPFYKCWSMGKLKKEELADYLKQYFYIESSFPRFMSGLHARTEDAEMRKVMLENLIHEEAGENNHVAQLLRLCDKGFDVKNIDVEPNAQTKALIKTFEEATTAEDIQKGLSAMIVYKQQVSDVAKTKIDGLREYYGIEGEETLEFYETHSAVNRDYHKMLDQIVNDEPTVLETIKEARNAFWAFLDGVTTPEIVARCEA